jgi:UMF1 family MFS transporter
MTKGESAGSASWRGLAGWVMFDWAAQPFYTLVLTFLFAPYFAASFIGDSVLGQEIWGYTTAAAGLIVAIASPLLGAIADASGRRKPWIALASLMLVAGLSTLWLAAPGASAMLLPVAAAVIVASVAAEIATVFTNAMMPALVPPDRLGRLSGIGWAVGYAGGLVSLVLAAGLLVADGETGRTMLGLRPVLPLDTLAREGERLIGPFSALWYVVFVVPLFLFTPDHVPGRHRKPLGAAMREGAAQLRDSLRHLRRYANIVRFLLARMLYADGLGAIFVFGGLYAAALFGWSAVELGVFGIVLSVAAGIGAALGGPLDDRFGARTVIVCGLIGLALACAGVLSVDRTHVLYGLEVLPASPSKGLFASAGEQVYLAFAVLIGLVAGPIQASSRSLMARLAPAGMTAEFFGLFAFSGKITAFAAPLAVGLVTGLTGSQRLGIASITVFLLGGLLLLLTVREER